MKKFKILFSEDVTWSIELEAKDEIEAQDLFQEMDLDEDTRARMIDVQTGELSIEEITE